MKCNVNKIKKIAKFKKRGGKKLKDILKMMAGGILDAGIKGITLAKKQISYVDL